MGPQKRLSVAALVVLVVGVGIGAAIYIFADEAVPDAIGYIVVNGEANPVARWLPPER